MTDAHWYLVMYDSADAARRRKLHRVMKDWGEALQYSVFRVQATPAELRRLRALMRRHFAEDEDRLVLARLCPSCAGRVLVEGRDADGVDFGDTLPDAFVV